MGNIFDIPTWVNPKVAPDRHAQIAKALYSIPGDLIGQRLCARVDTQTVKLYFRGELIKVHARVPAGRRQTDPADLPSELTAYAMRDLTTLHVPCIVALAILSVADNGLAFTAIVEYAETCYSGPALGIQNTGQLLVGSLSGPAFGAMIAATGYPTMFGITALAPLAAVLTIPGLRAASGANLRVSAKL
jgi:hypothetical protein